MPEGETPQTVSMLTWHNMVDVAKPGDRVEVTGIYRAMAVRVNPRMRTVRSLYKTYVDIVHVRKVDKGRLSNEGDKGNEGEVEQLPAEQSVLQESRDALKTSSQKSCQRWTKCRCSP